MYTSSLFGRSLFHHISTTPTQTTRYHLSLLRRRYLQTSRQYSTSQHSTRESKRVVGVTYAIAGAVSVSIATYTLGAFYPPQLITFLSPRPAPPPPDPNLPSSIAYTRELESKLQNLPFIKRLREAPDADEWYETRPYVNFPEERRANSLSAGTLHGPGKLALSPLLRVKKDESECIAITHLGRGLCGHDGIIHGGLIATVMDELLGRLSILNLPDKVGVTATLTIDYKAPTRADQFVVMRCHIVEKKGRKISVEGTVEDLEGKILARARALFVQPRYAKMLNTKMITQALGEPPVVAAEIPGGDPPRPLTAKA